MKKGNNINLAEWPNPLLEIIANKNYQDNQGSSIVLIDNLEDAKLLLGSLKSFIEIVEGTE